MRVQLPPRSTVVALVVKGTSWLPPKEQVQVRLLAGVLEVVSRISSAGSTKPGWQVRLLHDLLVRNGRLLLTEDQPSPCNQSSAISCNPCARSVWRRSKAS